MRPQYYPAGEHSRLILEMMNISVKISLSYAVTAHKAQGETLNEVIIDFGPKS